MHGLSYANNAGSRCALGDVEHVGGENQLIGVDVDGEQANGSHRQRRGTGTFVAQCCRNQFTAVLARRDIVENERHFAAL
jgi:hypothetical protein